MSIADVFSTVLLDHYRYPRKFGKMDNPDIEMDGVNPLCGDEVFLQVKVDGDKVTDAAFTGKACAICMASTSIFCEQAPGSTLSEIKEQKSRLFSLLEKKDLTEDERKQLGEIVSLEGVSQLPARVKCALLAWETWELMAKQLADGGK
jgi:nitrogen fixation NifU-like protein